MEHQHHEGGEGHKPKQITLRLSTRTIRIIAVVVVLLALGYYCKGFFVAANVDGRLISRLAVIRELESVSGKQALDSLIAQKLIRAEAKAKGLTATDEEVNAEVTKIEEQLKSQGGTLDQALAAQGLKLETLKRQLKTQVLLDKLVSGTVNITDEEVAQYIKDNQLAAPEGQEAEYNMFVKSQLLQQKLNSAKNAYVSDLRTKAKVSIFMDY